MRACELLQQSHKVSIKKLQFFWLMCFSLSILVVSYSWMFYIGRRLKNKYYSYCRQKRTIKFMVLSFHYLEDNVEMAYFLSDCLQTLLIMCTYQPIRRMIVFIDVVKIFLLSSNLLSGKFSCSVNRKSCSYYFY